MGKRRYNLAFVASSIFLLNQTREIADEQKEDIQLALKGLDDAVSVGKEMERSGVEVIVSRGGTSHMLRENLHIPVLSIPLTSFDVLNSVRKAASLGKRILLTTFRRKLGGIDILKELFHIELDQGVFHDTDSLGELILSAKHDGYDVIIGGGVSMRFGNQYGLNVVELQTNKDTIVSIIEDAKSVADAGREEQEKAQRYQRIIDSASEAIIAVDRNGLITNTNTSALHLLNVRNQSVEGRHITDFVPDAHIIKVLQTQQSVHNKIVKINNEMFLGNHAPIMVDSDMIGGISTYKDIPNVMKAENEVRRLFTKGLVAKYRMEDFIHKSTTIKYMIDRATKFAHSGSTILITGETGTGKEILAHSIHNLGPRKKGPFVSINCSALPDQLLESELFGYQEGAFTGSRRGGKPGLFELAHKGTIFLDEIGTTPLNVQARLLRVIQEKEVMRIGGDSVIPVDVRVLAATNKNLEKEVHEGRMREDLFFRINALTINIPPLRDRMEDIPLLAKALVRRAGNKYHIDPPTIPEPLVERLLDYSWPGNVRQLENFLERVLLLSGPEIRFEVFDELYSELYKSPSLRESVTVRSAVSFKEAMASKNRTYEYRLISKALEEENYSKSRAAKKLGISRTTLWRKLKEEMA